MSDSEYQEIISHISTDAPIQDYWRAIDGSDYTGAAETLLQAEGRHYTHHEVRQLAEKLRKMDDDDEHGGGGMGGGRPPGPDGSCGCDEKAEWELRAEREHAEDLKRELVAVSVKTQREAAHRREYGW